MFNKLDAMVIDSDYAYIGTFIGYLEMLLNVIVEGFKGLIAALGGLFEQSGGEDTAE